MDRLPCKDAYTENIKYILAVYRTELAVILIRRCSVIHAGSWKERGRLCGIAQARKIGSPKKCLVSPLAMSRFVSCTCPGVCAKTGCLREMFIRPSLRSTSHAHPACTSMASHSTPIAYAESSIEPTTPVYTIFNYAHNVHPKTPDLRQIIITSSMRRYSQM